MTEAVFWSLISLLNWSQAGDDEAVVAPVVKELSEMEVSEIYSFEDILAAKLFALDTRAHAQEIGEAAYREGEYFSVDEFLYARCVVVANGREFYESVLATPDRFPKDMEFEALLGIAAAAFELKTQGEFDHVSDVSYETFSNEAGWK